MIILDKRKERDGRGHELDCGIEIHPFVSSDGTLRDLAMSGRIRVIRYWNFDENKQGEPQIELNFSGGKMATEKVIALSQALVIAAGIQSNYDKYEVPVENQLIIANKKSEGK